MFDTNELNDKLVSELREMARTLGVTEADELRKPQLISRIIEQDQLIEAARAQQNTVETNYSPKNKAAAPEAAAENGERTRKRVRSTKPAKNEPRVEVPLDDTNLFDIQDDEPQQEEAEDMPVAPVEASTDQPGESIIPSEETSTEVRP